LLVARGGRPPVQRDRGGGRLPGKYGEEPHALRAGEAARGARGVSRPSQGGAVMNDTTPATHVPCAQLLDYVYGELDEARKRAFAEHLPGCPRCQAEVASFGRVRTAVRRIMPWPAVEPSAALGGVRHAQLMHTAAQRRPRRGVLLAFPRKL